MALLSFDAPSYHPWAQQPNDYRHDIETQKRWRSYGLLAPLIGTSYTLLFMMLSSLMVALVRDPGTVKPLEELEQEQEQEANAGDTRGDQIGEENEDISLAEALLSSNSAQDGDGNGEAFSLTPVKSTGESRWCRKCWAPKPERTHHCSECNRCVLKMDHHCPWLANRCVGARTYPSFLHFLFTTTLYSGYMFLLAIPPIQYFLGKPLILDDQDLTPYHAMTIALLGAFFSLTVGSFFVYHIYLTLTNQTTLEALAPMLLLQYLPDVHPEPAENAHHYPPHTLPHLNMHGDDVLPPPFSSQPPSPTTHDHPLHHTHTEPDSQSPPPYVPPPPGQRRSQMFAEPFRFPSPPPVQPTPAAPKRFQEHELNKKQRQLVREAHSRIRIYDMGWKENLMDVIGGGADLPSGKPRPSQWRIWAERIFWGGRGRGDGHTFRHNPKAEAQLHALARDLLAAASRS